VRYYSAAAALKSAFSTTTDTTANEDGIELPKRAGSEGGDSKDN